MATELETRTRTTTRTDGRRVFSGLNTEQRTEYRRPNFSSIDFDDTNQDTIVQTSYDTMVEEIAVDTPKKMDMLTVEKNIEQRPQTPLKIKLHARGKIIVSVLSVCICALMAFMIANFVTIGNLNGIIAQKQQVVIEQQDRVNHLQEQYDQLENSTEETAKNNGFTQIDNEQVSEIDMVNPLEKPQAEIEGNWFDNFCNWLSGLFN